jgi:TRAP-type mannitol/chloroaromatic compound transport system permease large subunit
MMAGLFILYIAIRCYLQPNLGPVLPKEERQFTWGEKIRLLSAGIIPLFIFFSMTGLFLMGRTSLVESSAVGAMASLIAAIARRKMTWKILHVSVEKTLNVTSMFMWIIIAALAFGAVFDGLGAVKAIEVFFLENLGFDRWTVLILMQLSFILMGTFLDDTAMLVIVAPLYVPMVRHMGFDLIWYGVLYTITCQIAYMTPPFGYNLFLMRAMAPPEITLTDIYRSVTPFVAIMMLGLTLVILFPQLALWLPHYLSIR